ncbi:putative tRNA-specific adenosine deaminase 1 [Drechmeria coniospora]|uniref:Putative tRNA-specific adenosine deaminase 1 n=1 Tax=Drechmeria coniospora TaxID=98403 RepID=A0A151GRV8_DRECN|nr:putative tRNA-specific adenosine deaminase 1 [Drechmeria coniospora]KYK59798.1 putative tRNA-specific adenosine deaminase 1 [Drechmeria coniospora]
MITRADLIAQVVITQFGKLPSKRKPAVRDNGLHDWVPLSGIVAEVDGRFTCLALATGMKCLPACKLPESNGNALHDWHAEILAIRTLNRFLLDDCSSLIENRPHSGLLQTAPHGGTSDEKPRTPPFRIRDNVKIHMYCSEAPCGDASMELTMAVQPDASPWQRPASGIIPLPDGSDPLPGRADFSQLGIVRRKPARGDAQPTLSKSCSDKLALKQATSLLCSLTALYVEPANAYVDTLVLPESQYSSVACARAFSETGRMSSVRGKTWRGGYVFRPFAVEATTVEFDFSRRAVLARAAEGISASNIAAAWSLSGVEESIINGVLQGRKMSDQRGASHMSRRQMWRAARHLARRLDGHDAMAHPLSQPTYRDVKGGTLLAEREAVKAAVRVAALVGWVPCREDADFNIDVAS